MSPRLNRNKVLLIDSVREFPFLYDRFNEDNKNRVKVDAKWSELAQKCGYDDGEDAKATWQNVVKARNRWKAATAQGYDSKPYLYEENLKFLDNYYPYKRTYSVTDNTSYTQELLNMALQSGRCVMEEDQISRNSGNEDQANMGEEYCEAPESKKARFSKENGNDGTVHISNISRSSLFEVPRKTESLGEAFGRTVGIALNRLTGKTQMKAQVEIMEVLLKYTED